MPSKLSLVLALFSVALLHHCGDDASSSKSYSYVCENGTPSTEKSDEPDVQKCAACNTSYTLKDDACVKDSAGSGGDSGSGTSGSGGSGTNGSGGSGTSGSGGSGTSGSGGNGTNGSGGSGTSGSGGSGTSGSGGSGTNGSGGSGTNGSGGSGTNGSGGSGTNGSGGTGGDSGLNFMTVTRDEDAAPGDLNVLRRPSANWTIVADALNNINAIRLTDANDTLTVAKTVADDLEDRHDDLAALDSAAIGTNAKVLFILREHDDQTIRLAGFVKVTTANRGERTIRVSIDGGVRASLTFSVYSQNANIDDDDNEVFLFVEQDSDGSDDVIYLYDGSVAIPGGVAGRIDVVKGVLSATTPLAVQATHLTNIEGIDIRGQTGTLSVTKEAIDALSESADTTGLDFDELTFQDGNTHIGASAKVLFVLRDSRTTQKMEIAGLVPDADQKVTADINGETITYNVYSEDDDITGTTGNSTFLLVQEVDGSGSDGVIYLYDGSVAIPGGVASRIDIVKGVLSATTPLAVQATHLTNIEGIDIRGQTGTLSVTKEAIDALSESAGTTGLDFDELTFQDGNTHIGASAKVLFVLRDSRTTQKIEIAGLVPDADQKVTTDINGETITYNVYSEDDDIANGNSAFLLVQEVDGMSGGVTTVPILLHTSLGPYSGGSSAVPTDSVVSSATATTTQSLSGASGTPDIIILEGDITLTITLLDFSHSEIPTAHPDVQALYTDAIATAKAGGTTHDGVDSTDRAMVILRDLATEKLDAIGFTDTGHDLRFRVCESGTTCNNTIGNFNVFKNSAGTHFLIVQRVSATNPDAGLRLIPNFPSADVVDNTVNPYAGIAFTSGQPGGTAPDNDKIDVVNVTAASVTVNADHINTRDALDLRRGSVVMELTLAITELEDSTWGGARANILRTTLRTALALKNLSQPVTTIVGDNSNVVLVLRDTLAQTVVSGSSGHPYDTGVNVDFQLGGSGTITFSVYAEYGRYYGQWLTQASSSCRMSMPPSHISTPSIWVLMGVRVYSAGVTVI